VLERTETSPLVDLPTCGPGSGESVARTFSVMCGASPGSAAEFTGLWSPTNSRGIGLDAELLWCSSVAWWCSLSLIMIRKTLSAS
jgi:hypothetical protein